MPEPEFQSIPLEEVDMSNITSIPDKSCGFNLLIDRLKPIVTIAKLPETGQTISKSGTPVDIILTESAWHKQDPNFDIFLEKIWIDNETRNWNFFKKKCKHD